MLAAVVGLAVAAVAARIVTARSLSATYEAEVRRELAKLPAEPPPPITEAAIARLPAPVQKYIRASGFIGKPHTRNARLVWTELLLRRARDGAFMHLGCTQLNDVAEPARIVLMRGKVAGFIPFEGRDKYQDGHGHMLIKAAKVFTVVNSTGKEMDESALVTILAEALIVPSMALQPYITWQPIDARTAGATLSYAGTSVRGTFHFNDAGEMVRFETDDRWQDGTPPRRIRWSATMGGYRAQDGMRLPTEVAATWHEAAGDFLYVKGTIGHIAYNVKE